MQIYNVSASVIKERISLENLTPYTFLVKLLHKEETSIYSNGNEDAFRGCNGHHFTLPIHKTAYPDRILSR